jgi:hypothetical protein
MSQFNLPPGARNVGIFGGLILMALGLVLGYVQAGQQTPLAQTGGPAPAKADDGSGIFKAIVEWLTAKKMA